MSTTHSADLPRLDPIRPEVEALIRRHAAGAVVAERPRRRVGFLSAVGGVAFAAACTVALVVFGVSTGTQLASPQRAVAAVAHSLEGDGVLHWVRRVEVENPAVSGTPEAQVVEQWIDLSNGDSHMVTTGQPSASGEPPRTEESWFANGEIWFAARPNADGTPRIRLAPSEVGSPTTVVEELRSSLERGERGEAEIAEAGDLDGVPVVVVIDRPAGNERRTWITRGESPRVVRIVETVASGNGSRVTTTSTTLTWEVLRRTEATLANVQIPTDATRRP